MIEPSHSWVKSEFFRPRFCELRYPAKLGTRVAVWLRILVFRSPGIVKHLVYRVANAGARHAKLAQGKGWRLFALVAVQNPLTLSPRSELAPELMLLRARGDFYEGANPTPADTLLVIEISDTSLRYDREVKVPLYAAHGVPEVWLIDLKTGALSCFATPASTAINRSCARTRARSSPRCCCRIWSFGCRSAGSPRSRRRAQSDRSLSSCART
jgi:hypothetical protein